MVGIVGEIMQGGGKWKSSLLKIKLLLPNFERKRLLKIQLFDGCIWTI